MELGRFDELIGHEDAAKQLQHAIEGGTVAHAYILSGERGSGKRTLATLFAAALLCEEGGTEPCGHCTSCRKAFSGNHPDLIYVAHEKPNVITVDEIREQVVGPAEIRPYESRYKIFIVSDADKMNPQAQNALLKTIEEPAAYVVVLLLAQSRDALLPTIRSRCAAIDLKSIDTEKLRRYLLTELHVSSEDALVIAAFSQGNIGRARALATGSEFSEIVDNAVRLLSGIRSMSVRQCISQIALLTQEKQSIYDYLDLFEMWYRDVLLFKATRDIDSLIFRGQTAAITEQANISSYEGLETVCRAIDTARGRLRANVNFEITMELLFLTMQEN